MFCCPGRVNRQDYEQNKTITAELRKEKRARDKEMKLLLLGAGESGKSTMAKQMRIIHSSGFPDYECKNFRHVVYANLFTAIRILIVAARTLNYQLLPANEAAANRLYADEEPPTTTFMGPLTQEHVEDIKALWQDPAIQKAFIKGHEFHLSDSASYYLNSLERLALPNYIPTQQDILRVRAKTMGIVEISFIVDNVKFKMVDVGGQRSERRKWIHCFQDVTAVIFFAALSEYDMKLVEDGVTNRMHDSLKIFGEVCNNEFFRDTAMILFLNKRDLFEDKISRVPLNVCFPEYDGINAYKEGIKYISDKFLAMNQNSGKNIYIHVTCATDTECIIVVFNAVKDIILRNALLGAGIL